MRHLHAMGAGLPTCNPAGGGNSFVNLLVGRAKLGFVSDWLRVLSDEEAPQSLGIER